MALIDKLAEIKAQIDALLDYANGTTGVTDTRLGDAVRTLAAGYGGGGKTYALTLYKKYDAFIKEATMEWIYSNDSASTRIRCRPNTTYRIRCTTNVPIFRCISVSSDEEVTSSKAINGYNLLNPPSGFNDTLDYTTSANAKYFIIQVTKGYADQFFANMEIESV